MIVTVVAALVLGLPVLLAKSTYSLQGIIEPLPKRRSVSLPRCLSSLRCGFGGGGGVDASADSGNNEETDGIEIIGSPSDLLDGLYMRTEWEMNGRSHFEKTVGRSDSNAKGNNKIHLYWSGSQWVIHYDLDPSRNFQNLLAYARVKVEEVEGTKSNWFVKTGQSFESCKSMFVGKPGESSSSLDLEELSPSDVESKEVMGVPRQLLPFYIAFMMDAIATGIAMPLLPFYVMELGASAMQLSLVISSNYVAQMVGCIVMGRVSDIYGRRVVLTLCLAASSISYFAMSHARTLKSVALAKIIAGSFGGLVPIMQSGVADVSSMTDRPKYIGRIMATFGMGFVLGPALSALMPGFSTREKVRMAALLPLTGLIVAVLFAKETKKETKGVFAGRKVPVGGQPIKVDKKSDTTTRSSSSKAIPPVSIEVLSLVVNGFLLMYAFSTESIYAMFIKDSFGYGERVLSTLFAVNGLFIGIFQVFFIKPMINMIGKHATLAFGNLSLAIGMIGVALVRKEIPHFMLFASHVVGYSIADTALASLIARYSTSTSQGRDFALNQAAQSCARILSPLVAGLLYERSKQVGEGAFPKGALPFLVGAMCPAIAVVIPSLLYIRSVARKRGDKGEGVEGEEEVEKVEETGVR